MAGINHQYIYTYTKVSARQGPRSFTAGRRTLAVTAIDRGRLLRALAPPCALTPSAGVTTFASVLPQHRTGNLASSPTLDLLNCFALVFLIVFGGL